MNEKILYVSYTYVLLCVDSTERSYVNFGIRNKGLQQRQANTGSEKQSKQKTDTYITSLLDSMHYRVLILA